MQKPQGYDDVQLGDFTPVELGGHHMIIKAVKEQQTKTGDPMIVVAFDFADDDVQPHYFADQFDKDIRPDKKWPFNGTKYIMTMDYKDKTKTSRDFKRFITSVEHSNNILVEWGDKFCEQFKGKKVGGVFGIVEEEYNGKIQRRHQLRWFCDYEKSQDANVPDPKLLETPGDVVSVPVADPGLDAVPFL